MSSWKNSPIKGFDAAHRNPFLSPDDRHGDRPGKPRRSNVLTGGPEHVDAGREHRSVIAKWLFIQELSCLNHGWATSERRDGTQQCGKVILEV